MPPAIHQFQFRLLTPPVLVPRRFQWVFAPVSCDSLNLPGGLLNLGSSGSPYDLTSSRSKKSCCFFSLFRAGVSPSMTVGDRQARTPGHYHSSELGTTPDLLAGTLNPSPAEARVQCSQDPLSPLSPWDMPNQGLGSF